MCFPLCGTLLNSVWYCLSSPSLFFFRSVRSVDAFTSSLSLRLHRYLFFQLSHVIDRQMFNFFIFSPYLSCFSVDSRYSNQQNILLPILPSHVCLSVRLSNNLCKQISWVSYSCVQYIENLSLWYKSSLLSFRLACQAGPPTPEYVLWVSISATRFPYNGPLWLLVEPNCCRWISRRCCWSSTVQYCPQQFVVIVVNISLLLVVVVLSSV